VHDFGQGIIEVTKIDKDGKPTVRKFVTPEELKEWNRR
jgi:hypothetical protein